MAEPEKEKIVRHTLTPREHSVAELAMRGLSNRDIASAECLAYSTVHKCMQKIFQKCCINRRTQLTRELINGLADKAARR